MSPKSRTFLPKNWAVYKEEPEEESSDDSLFGGKLIELPLGGGGLASGLLLAGLLGSLGSHRRESPFG